MKRATLLPSAKAYLLDIFTDIATRSQSVRVAQKFDKKIRAYCNHLASLPFQIGRARPDLHPELPCSAFDNYIVLFRYSSTRFELVNIIEGHRDIALYLSETTPV